MIRRQAALEDFEAHIESFEPAPDLPTDAAPLATELPTAEVEAPSSDAEVEAASFDAEAVEPGGEPLSFEVPQYDAEPQPSALSAEAEFDDLHSEIGEPDPFALPPHFAADEDREPHDGLSAFHAATGFSAAQEAFSHVELAPYPSGGFLAEDAEAFASGAVAPRIAIHIFTERPDTTEIAQRAAADRRMSRATTEVRPGGLSAALGAYGSVPTPPLLVVESHEPADTLLAGLDRLAEACDPGTKVMVIGKTNDIRLYRELMSRGVSEYLVAPLGPLQLVQAVTQLYSEPGAAFLGRTIAFVGAKGGVGASTLAHNFAYGLSEHVQAATSVVDYDLAFGTASLDFNQEPEQGLHDALLKPERVDATLLDRMAARCSDRLSLFAAPATLDEDWDIGVEAYEEVGAKLRAASPYVVLDLPHLWSAWMRATLISADDVIIVAGPDLASLRNGKNLIDLIKRSRKNDKPPMLVINQVGVPNRPEIPVKDFTKAMGMEPSLVLPFDAKLFGQAANNGQMILQVNAKAKASEGLLQFVQQVSRRTVAAPKPKGLLERLTGRS